MSKSPTKSNVSSACYRAKELSTPNKDNNEISITVFIRVSNLHNLLTNWMRLIDKGTKICKAIYALKLHELQDHYYPIQTEILTESLVETLHGLKNVVDGIEILNNQMKALTKLQPEGGPVIFTWSVSQIAENISNIFTLIRNEYTLKNVIVENIAHCRDEGLMEVYSSSWELEAYFNMEFSEYLFAETGLPGIIKCSCRYKLVLFPSPAQCMTCFII